MATPALMINARYQVKGKPIGQGGMGVVYKAYDVVTKRDVALKTMRGTLNPAALELFTKEWTLLARISHPNIVDILDSGEFEQEGERKPFFVMPLLPGTTLEQLIVNSSTRLTVDRVVGIAAQTCRGLQAAHEHGLIHRDLKPSNLFVMDDDTVKIIDFGVLHLAGADSIKALKGTLQYMAPEQIEMKPTTAASDIFSLGVVCYQALTGRKPFARKTEAETIDAIRRHIPPPVCELNPLVSQIISRVIHKAMAKDPWHRFSTAREYSETLQKALIGQPIERFDREKIQPRIERAKKAHQEGDHQFASEILGELEAEGNIDPDMTLLRIQIDQAIRHKSVRQLLDSARTRLEEEEYPLALQKIQEVLGLDPDNADALALRKEIEKQRSERQTQNWFRLVEQHLHNRAFDQARQALGEIMKLNTEDTRAREMLAEVDRREDEINRLREEKERLYQSAVNCYQHGEVSSALSKLERVLDLNRQSPDSSIPDRDAQYQSLYNQIRSERDAARSAYAEGRRHLSDRNFARTLAICAEFLKKSPGDPMFQALKLEAEEQQRQEQSSYIAEVGRRVESEADLDRRVNILKEATERYPDEPHFQQSLRLVKERRDLVNSIVGKARQYEERGQYNEALSQFDILRNIYAPYPGLEYETERLKRRRDEQIREEAKGRWVDQIDRHIAAGDYARARELVHTATREFPNDRELAGLERLAQQGVERSAEAEEWLSRGQELCFDRQFGEGLEALRKAASLDGRNAVIRAALLNALVEEARSLLGQDWRAAEPLIEQALSIDAAHPLARSLQGLVLDYKRQEILNDCVSRARDLQANGDVNGALAHVEQVLATYPNEIRLVQLRSTLRNMGAGIAPEITAPHSLDASAVAPGRDPAIRALPESVAPKETTRPLVTDSPFSIDRSVLAQRSTVEIVPDTPPPPEPPAPLATKDVASGPTVMTRAKVSLGKLTGILQSWAEPSRRFSKLQMGFLAAIAVLLVLVLAVGISKRRPAAPPTPVVVHEYFVDLESNVANAYYKVDGKPAPPQPMRLEPGPHTVEASLTGYKSATQSIHLVGGLPKPYVVSLKLEPEPVRLSFSSGLKSGQVRLDDQAAVDLQDGGFVDSEIAVSADHTFILSRAGNEALKFTFRAEPGGIVTLLPSVKAKDVSAVIIATLGSNARVYASDTSLKGALVGGSPQPILADGLELRAIMGKNEFKIEDGKFPLALPIEASNSPTLTVWLASDPNLGTLELDLKAPDVSGSLDGRRPQALKAWKHYFQGAPGPHRIRLTREGFEAIEMPVDFVKGKMISLTVPDWKPLVRTGSLSIEGGTREAEVLIDGGSRGHLSSEGSFALSEIQPGEHTITLRKPEWEDTQLTKTFAAGEMVHIAGADAVLRQWGSLVFRITPGSATVTYKRLDEAQTHTAEARSVPLRAGRYLVTASASGYQTKTDTISVQPGTPAPVEWTLTTVVEKAPVPAPSVPKASVTARDYFLEAKNWTQDGKWWIHPAGTTAWAKNNMGTYVFDFLRQTKNFIVKKTTRHVEWVVDQQDSGDRIEYDFDFNSIERKAFHAGKPESKKTKVTAGACSDESCTIKVDVSPARIVVTDSRGRVLDNYDRPNPSQALGKFGIKGEVALTLKSFNPQ
jgi:serine/threonine-protein kinase